MVLHSVITRDSVCGNNVYEFCMAPKIGCVVYNFMNIPHWIPGKSEKFPSPFPVPRRAPYGVTTLVSTTHSELQTTEVLYTYAMQWTTFVFQMLCIKKVCYVQLLSKKCNFHNGMKSTVTISNTPMLCSVFINWMKHTRTCTYKMKSVTTKPCSLHYTYRRNCSSTTKMKLSATQQDRWPAINTHAEKLKHKCTKLQQAKSVHSELAVLW
jgi:hypothetical protein